MSYWEYARHYLFGEDTYSHKKPADTQIDTRNQVFRNWLYSSEDWSDSDYRLFQLLYSTKRGKQWIDSYYDERVDDEYRNRYDIRGYGHDPRKWRSSDNSPIVLGYTSLNFVSDNVKRLYK